MKSTPRRKPAAKCGAKAKELHIECEHGTVPELKYYPVRRELRH